MSRFLFLVIINVFFSNVYSQTTLQFCTAVDPTGYCVLNNTKFISSPDSTRALIYMKVMNPRGIPSTKIIYKVFNVGAKGEETYYNTFVQSIQSGWDSSWQPDHFPTPGIFMVRVYDETDKEMCSKSFELRKDW